VSKFSTGSGNGRHRRSSAYRPNGYIVDTSHIVGWTGGLEYQVRKVGGLKSLFLSGEGLVCEFRGQGRVWVSTRNPSSLAAFLQPFRPVKNNGQKTRRRAGNAPPSGFNPRGRTAPRQ